MAGEYIPVWVKEKPFVSPEALAAVLGHEPPSVHAPTSDPRICVERMEKGAHHQTFRVAGPAEGRVVLNISYFPGWRATVDGTPIQTEVVEPEGLIAVRVPPGEHRLELRFEDTEVRRVGHWVSLASLGVCVLLLVAADRRFPRVQGRPPALARDIERIASVRPHSRRAALARVALLLAVLALVPIAAAAQTAPYGSPPGVQRPLKIDLNGTLLLLGYDLRVGGPPLGRTESVPPGTTLDVTTHWRSIGSDTPGVAVRPYARLSNIDDQHWAMDIGGSLLGGTADGMLRGQASLRVPEGLPPGVYQVELGALDGDGRPMPVRGRELVELLPVQTSVRVGPIQVRRGVGEVLPLRLPSGATWDARVVLGSFDLHAGISDRRARPEPLRVDATTGAAELQAGETLQIDLLWRALQPHPGRLTVSAALEDTDGHARAVRASEPLDGMYPTWLWSAGEQVRDQLRLPIPPATPPGRYQLRLTALEQGLPLAVSLPGEARAAVSTRLADVALGAPAAQLESRSPR